jgi:ABC-type nitrate/sulfonate/bicarbonate transport system substrate-binding protein
MNSTVKVAVFPGAGNLPLFVGVEKEIFARHDVTVEIVPIRSAPEQMEGLTNGSWELAHTSPDNVIAYSERGGDLFMFMGGEIGPLTFFVRPEIHQADSLRGKEIGVDAIDTGFAFLVRKMLARQGLGPGEYRLRSVGGTNVRFEALVNGEIAGCLLNLPFDLLAGMRGMKSLCAHHELFKHYQVLAGGARRGWAKDHAALLTEYVRGYLDALDWLLDASHGEEAVAILARSLRIESDLAEKIYDVLREPGVGLSREAALSAEGIETVISLREEMGGFQGPRPRPEQFVDLTFNRSAHAGTPHPPLFPSEGERD